MSNPNDLDTVVVEVETGDVKSEPMTFADAADVAGDHNEAVGAVAYAVREVEPVEAVQAD